MVAAASNAARMVRAGGGFVAEADEPVMIAQVQLVGVADPAAASARAIEAARRGDPGRWPGRRCRACARAAAARATSDRCAVRALDGPAPARRRHASSSHLHVDCRDAMGANLVNTVAEAVADRAGRAGRAAARACASSRTCATGAGARRGARALGRRALGRDRGHRRRRACAAGIVAASRFAELDPYRAATHNKGIMNGVDAVVIATGNDWRGVEAGAHAYAARGGRYGPLATWAARGRRAWSAGSSCRWRSAPSAAPCRCTRARAWRCASWASSPPRELAHGRRPRRPGLEPGRAARARHRGHPARSHGAARPRRGQGRGAGRRSRRAGGTEEAL